MIVISLYDYLGEAVDEQKLREAMLAEQAVIARAANAEAKLARAVAALEEIASYDIGPFAGVAYTARTALDELEKTE